MRLLAYKLALLGALHCVPAHSSFADTESDLILTTLSGISVGALTFFEEDLAASRCRWCSSNSVDSSARDALRWSNRGLANRLSHISGFVVSPALALGSHAWLNAQDHHFENFYSDALVIAEASLLAALAGQLIQLSVARERPDTHYGLSPRSNAANTSFYSGHTTIAFSLATASGTLAILRNREAAPWIWAGGLSIAGLTGYLRLAADRHYLTDVLVGAVAGSAIGFAIPYFFHQSPTSENSRRDFYFSVSPSADGILARLDLRF